MKRSAIVFLSAGLAVLSVQAVVSPVQAAPRPALAAPRVGDPVALIKAAADRAAASGLDALAKGPDERYVRRALIKGGNPGKRDLYYASYDRLYKGLPVIGGDAVVATDAIGNVLSTSSARTDRLAVAITPTVTSAQALRTARARVSRVDSVVSNTLSVLGGGTGKLVWESVLTGRKAGGAPSRLHVYVDARTRAVVGTKDDSRAGTGNSQYNGPNIAIDTSNNSTVDSTRPGLRCADYSSQQPFTSANNTFGTGSAYDKVTGCADVLYAVQNEWRMLSSWLGRNGIDGNGGGNPVLVGLPQVNAYWTGDHIEIGENTAGQWISSMDVVGHEEGHAIDQYTPGGAGSESGLGEATGDIFGAMTEAYTQNPYDTPDYTVGEEVNLTGSGPIRNMANPSSVNGDPNCYSSAIPGTEVHAAAGPMNHWFYLLAQGSSGSPTCNNTTISGIGIQAAGKIFYNAMLQKTSGSTYFGYRKWTLAAAKALDPSCAQYNVVKAAWLAVSVPAQSGEATCSGTPGNEFSLSLSPSAGSVQPGSSTSATVSTTTTAGSSQMVALTASGQPAGVTVGFSPSSVVSGASSTMTVATTAAATPGTYTITVKGTGTTSHTATYSLTVGGTATRDFSIAVNPAAGTVTAGQSAVATVSTSTTAGAAQAVALTATGQPAGVTVSFNPSSVTSGASAMMNVATAAAAAPGTYSVTVKGSGTVAHTVVYNLTVRGSGPPPTGCGGLLAWSSTKSYVPNDQVSYNGHKWNSTWYSTGAVPDAPSSWAVWSDAGAC